MQTISFLSLSLIVVLSTTLSLAHFLPLIIDSFITDLLAALLPALLLSYSFDLLFYSYTQVCLPPSLSSSASIFKAVATFRACNKFDNFICIPEIS